MTEPSGPDRRSEFEAAQEAEDKTQYVLQLFVTGVTASSMRAIANLKTLCETHLAGRYTLDVVDLYEQPGQARANQVLAVPTLIKILPQPLRRIIGDLSNEEQVLVGLNLKPVPAPTRPADPPPGLGGH